MTAASPDPTVAYLPMVRAVVRRLRRVRVLPRSVEDDDLVSVGVMGLLEARARFRTDGGARFETFAEHRVRGALLDYLRREAMGSRQQYAAIKRGEAPALRQVPLDPLDGTELVATITPEPDWTRRLLVRATMARLSPRDRYVLVQSFFADRALHSIGRSLGVNASRVSQIRTRALQRARAVVEGR